MRKFGNITVRRTEDGGLAFDLGDGAALSFSVADTREVIAEYFSATTPKQDAEFDLFNSGITAGLAMAKAAVEAQESQQCCGSSASRDHDDGVFDCERAIAELIEQHAKEHKK